MTRNYQNVWPAYEEICRCVKNYGEDNALKEPVFEKALTVSDECFIRVVLNRTLRGANLRRRGLQFLISPHSVATGLLVDESVRNAFVKEMTDLKSLVVNERRAGMKARRKECLDAFTAATETLSA